VAAPPEGDGFWQSADPAALGLDPGAIQDHLALVKASGADGVLVGYRGKVVSEWYSPRYRTPVATMSSVKSVTGLLTGLLVADGKLAVDDPVSRFVPTWAEGRRGRVTIRHLLTMTSGLSRDGLPNRGVGMAADKSGYVVGLEPANEPGTRWEYSNEGVQLLSPILEKAAGVPLQDYARDRLFRPLGMNETRLRLDGKGHAWTYADAETSLRDFARLGELMRNKGRWQGRPVVPEAWVDASTRPCPQSPAYGYLWWLVDDPKGFAARGYLDTHCYVFPGLELVVARVQTRPYLFATESYEPKALALFKRIVRK
jgi:CubicO group peptidase (beta-lactamase class C family)